MMVANESVYLFSTSLRPARCDSLCLCLGYSSSGLFESSSGPVLHDPRSQGSRAGKVFYQY
jgi:hypothetical protein